jgi:hypothetical protein
MVGEPVETWCMEGLWRNSVGREGPVLAEYPSREAAMEAARVEARVRGVQHIVRDQDGAVVERNRYPRRSEEIPG